MDMSSIVPAPNTKPAVSPVLIVLLLFIIIGLGLIAGGWVWLKHTRQFITHSSMATGRLVDYVVDNNDDGTFYKPVVRFTTVDGQEIEYHSSTGSTFKPQRIGTEVRIHYDPANPQHAAIDSVLDVWFGPIILIVIGAFFIAIPTTILVVTRGKL